MIFIDETGIEDFSDPKNPTLVEAAAAPLLLITKRESSSLGDD
jgi:hypothetical protein